MLSGKTFHSFSAHIENACPLWASSWTEVPPGADLRQRVDKERTSVGHGGGQLSKDLNTNQTILKWNVKLTTEMCFIAKENTGVIFIQQNQQKILL